MAAECVYCHATAPVPLMQVAAWECLDGIDCFGRQELQRDALKPGDSTGLKYQEPTAVMLTGEDIRHLCLTLRLVVQMGGSVLEPDVLAKVVALHDKLRPLEPTEIVDDEGDEQMDDILAMFGIGQ